MTGICLYGHVTILEGAEVRIGFLGKSYKPEDGGKYWHYF